MKSKRPSRAALGLRKAPIQCRSREKVAALIEACACVLERTGLQDFKTNAVAHEAGVSIGSMYQYFPSKQALIAALLAREAQTYARRLEDTQVQACWRTALSLLITVTVEQQLHRPDLARALKLYEPWQTAKLPQEQPRLQSVLIEILSRTDAPQPANVFIAADDIAAIVFAMADSARERNEHPKQVLPRIEQVIIGYLSTSQPS